MRPQLISYNATLAVTTAMQLPHHRSFASGMSGERPAGLRCSWPRRHVSTATTVSDGRIKFVAWKRQCKSTLVGFATIELPIGLIIKDVPVCCSHGRAWASLPAKAQIDKAGQTIRNERGKVAYDKVLEWNSSRVHDAFIKRVVALVRTLERDAFGSGA